MLLATAKTMESRREWDIRFHDDTRRLNTSDPSIIAPIKLANIMPNGRSPEFPAAMRVAFNAGVQKKTKRYIEPSKKQEESPIVRMRLSNHKVSFTPVQIYLMNIAGVRTAQDNIQAALSGYVR